MKKEDMKTWKTKKHLVNIFNDNLKIRTEKQK